MSIGQNKTILLVENEKIIAMSEKMELESIGYKVITVNTGEDCIKLLENENSIDIVLMDIDLGEGINGLEAGKTIQENYNIPIVFLSSHEEPEMVEKTKIITSYGYVVKNSDIAVIEASIQMAFKLFEVNQQQFEMNE